MVLAGSDSGCFSSGCWLCFPGESRYCWLFFMLLPGEVMLSVIQICISISQWFRRRTQMDPTCKKNWSKGSSWPRTKRGKQGKRSGFVRRSPVMIKRKSRIFAHEPSYGSTWSKKDGFWNLYTFWLAVVEWMGLYTVIHIGTHIMTNQLLWMLILWPISYYRIWLVVWNMWIYFSIKYGRIIPIDELIFFKMIYPLVI